MMMHLILKLQKCTITYELIVDATNLTSIIIDVIYTIITHAIDDNVIVATDATMVDSPTIHSLFYDLPDDIF